ncbi:hypothetical protein HMPREF0083_02333 [Aneurinibacillus aneurinilyticus ATCC 12856]|uniref:Uncharacterized protein n=1 Tax=Aneurinibacillus aneurinilyticus ATCC 12856 TaxID=649747 RepID=U1X3R9_ANEAE|nr:hypothetical protein HMPREF0083_02333 [Aneurinibacillus aneurinilyticus ATCC 12856]
MYKAPSDVFSDTLEGAFFVLQQVNLVTVLNKSVFAFSQTFQEILSK